MKGGVLGPKMLWISPSDLLLCEIKVSLINARFVVLSSPRFRLVPEHTGQIVTGQPRVFRLDDWPLRHEHCQMLEVNRFFFYLKSSALLVRLQWGREG